LSSKEEILHAGFDLSDPEYEEITLIGKQEETIRNYAEEKGFKRGLTGFHMFLRSEGWTYYDILKEAYK